MNKLMITLVTGALLFSVNAQEAAPAPEPVPEPAPVTEEAAPVAEEVAPVTEEAAPVAEAQPQGEMEDEDTPNVFWGFANYGIYSGYQLYGSLVNSEPTLQGYAEVNANLRACDWDLGYLGVGIWSNSDLTAKRQDSLGQMFNEWDFNVHWGKTFWFDDERQWGLTYRTTVVWFYYPRQHQRNADHRISTTMDWDHYFELNNPYITPFVNVVHEYRHGGSLLDMGLKKSIAVCDKLTLTPSAAIVWRDHNYGWCFPGYGYQVNGQKADSGFATVRVGIDANYQLTEHVGLFAKVAFCSVIDNDLRSRAEEVTGDTYGKYKDFAWGGAGLNVNF